MRMRRMKGILACLTALLLGIGAAPAGALAADYQLGYSTRPSDNNYIFTTRTPKGRIGKSMTISFRIRANGGDMTNVRVSLAQTDDFQQIEDKGTGDYTVDYYPFEITETTFVPKSVGDISADKVKSVSLSAQVRKDAAQGYYSIPILLECDETETIDYVNVWISTDSTDDEEEDELEEGNYFVIGENQSTPRGVYPNVLDYAVNFRNKSDITAQDVTIHMELSEDDAKFPFEINDGNYDRYYERIGYGETVAVPYSMAIREDSYTGYYPIKFTITFRLSSEGDLHTEEGIFYVHIESKDKEDDLGDFDANDRTRARLIVESYYTIPEVVYAGEEFELVLNMKNASTDVPASNILFTMESEKVEESAVFTTESGSSSLVVDALSPGQSAEIRARYTARAGVDQRSYAITVKEKYDSPEFKNAEESITVDIPVKQYARLSTSSIDVMPESITIGSESNVMFGINNTGKVVLYNVTVSFSGDSIKPVDAYVGNIKPGETGNVDTMLTGLAPTMDDGLIHISISYEDENGTAAEPVEREMTLMVTEAVDDSMWDDPMMDGMDGMEEEPSFFGKYKGFIIAGLAAAAAGGVLLGFKIRKKRRAAREEDTDDEIS